MDLVIFDCDGVLIDSEPIASRTLAETLTAAGCIISPKEVLITFTGKSEPDLIKLCRSLFGEHDFPAIFSVWKNSIFPAFHRDLKLVEGIEHVLQTCPAPKCVASNSSLERLINSLGTMPIWHDFAPHIYSAELVSRPKPAPDLPLYCLSKFGARPDRSIFVDDSPSGIRAACAAGIPAIGFITPGDPRPDRHDLLESAGAKAVVQGAAELKECLDNWS